VVYEESRGDKVWKGVAASGVGRWGAVVDWVGRLTLDTTDCAACWNVV
jgi:hypothetical protein